MVCTTDDPADSLEYHQQIKDNPFGVKVLPTWRPDKAMAIENPVAYKEYIQTLSQAADIPVAYKEYIQTLSQAADMPINTYADLIAALRVRHKFFEELGCRLSDHGMDTFYAEDYTEKEIED